MLKLSKSAKDLWAETESFGKSGTHKYIRREGGPGNWTYFYADEGGKEHGTHSSSELPPHLQRVADKINTQNKNHGYEITDVTPDWDAPSHAKPKNENEYRMSDSKGFGIKQLESLGVENKYKSHPLSRQREKMLDDAISQGLVTKFRKYDPALKDYNTFLRINKFKTGQEVVDPTKPVGSYKDIGKVTKINEDGTLNIKYQSGHEFKNIHPDKVKQYENEVGKKSFTGGAMVKLAKSARDLWNDTEKMTKGGEGSRGGKVIGHTKSGKPVYEDHDHAPKGHHDNWTAEDHDRAATLHSIKEQQHAHNYSTIGEKTHHESEKDYHNKAWRAKKDEEKNKSEK